MGFPTKLSPSILEWYYFLQNRWLIWRIALFKFLYPNLHVYFIFAYFVLLLFKVNFLIRPPSSKHHNRNNPHLGWSSKQNNCKTPISWQIRHEQFKAKRMKATCINNRSCKRMTTILLDSGMMECPKNGGKGAHNCSVNLHPLFLFWKIFGWVCDSEKKSGPYFGLDIFQVPDPKKYQVDLIN